MNILKIKKWLKKNSFDCDVKKDSYVSYSQADETIYISDDFSDYDNSEKLYVNYVNHLGCTEDLSPTTYAFLHELGHYETIDDLPEIDFIVNKLKKLIETPSLTDFVRRLKANIYYRLPVERKATLWAIDFIKSNIDEVLELEGLLNVK